MPNRTPLLSLAALLLAGAALVGCGGGGAEPPPQPVGNSTTTPDTTAPTVQIANDVAAPTATGPVTFTFVFSEDVGTSFSASDVVVTGGSVGAFTRQSGSQATVVVTPPANATGTIAVSVAAGTFTDIAGNANTVATNASKDYVTGPGGGSGGATAPTTAPATTIPSGSTVIYSDSGVVNGLDTCPNWGQSTVCSPEQTIAGNKLLKYANLNYQGLDWSASAQNVSAKTKLHVDFWSPDLTSVKVSIISSGKENAYTQALTTGTWNSVDIDLSNYTVPDKTAIIQVKLEATTPGTLYVDNIYFWGSAGGGGSGATAPTNAPTTAIPSGATVIYSDTAAVTGLDSCPNWGQATVCGGEQTIAGNKSLKYSNLNYQGLDWSAHAQDVSAKSKLHIDFWSPDLTSVKVSIISSGKENAFTQTLTAGTWNSVDIDLSNYTVPDKTAIIQIKLESTTPGTLYVDNIYFWGGASAAGCGTTEPTCAPSTAVPAGAVVIYSDAAAVTGIDSCPNWGQSTVCGGEQTLAGNKLLKYSNLNYQGLDWSANAQNVSAKGKLHIDFWTPDLTSVKVSVIGGGKENAFTQTLTTKGWNTVDIPLSNYTAPDLSAVNQIKLESTGPGTLYVDNIYFWDTASSSNPATVPDMGSGGAVTIPVASASDKFGFILSGDAVFAGDYVGPIDSNGNHAKFDGATTTGAASGGAIGYFNDTTLSTSAQKIEEGGWVSGSIDQQGVPNFFRYFVLTAPASTFASSYMGLFANAPSNGTVNVSSYASLKMLLWGPAGMYEQGNFNPTLEVVLAGPKIAGCTATGSGGTELSQALVANKKIGAASAYKMALSGFTVKGVCGTDTNATAVASVLSKLARVAITVPATSFNFTNANAGGSQVTYSTGVNIGPIGFTNQ